MRPSDQHDDADDVPEALPAEDDVLDAVPDYTDDIRVALRVLMTTDADDQTAMVAAIMRGGVRDRALATRLFQLIPIAWGRLLLPMAGVHIVSDEYIEVDRRSQKRRRRRLSEEPMYQQIMEVLPDAIIAATSRQKDRLTAWSAEVQNARALMRKGTPPSSVVLGPVILM